MEADGRAARTRSFLLGGLLGASAVLAAVRRRPSTRTPPPREHGLAAFEGAPCYRERVARDATPVPTSESRAPRAPAVR